MRELINSALIIGLACVLSWQVVERINDKSEYNKKEKELNNELNRVKQNAVFDNNEQLDLQNKLIGIEKRIGGVNAKITELLNRPVYSNICVDVDGVRVANSYAGKNPASFINGGLPTDSTTRPEK